MFFFTVSIQKEKCNSLTEYDNCDTKQNETLKSTFFFNNRRRLPAKKPYDMCERVLFEQFTSTSII
jgi:hypothetical protein